MDQAAKIIDVTRSYVPVDPRTFPRTLHATEQEDRPEQRFPVIPFDGQNFMPSAYGYKSYFGTTQKLNIDNLVAKIDKIFLYQNLTLENVLIALCDSGIWYKDGGETGSWTQLVAKELSPDPLAYFPWSMCIIENDVYAYRQGDPTFYRLYSTAADTLLFQELTPTFLNMEGQIGLFKAGSRLGFWDSDNSLAWSNLDNFADFTPSVLTLAGSAKFTDIVGTIVTVLSHGDGFMIYATKSILYVRKAPGELFQWDPLVVMTNNGIVFERQAAATVPDTRHFAYTSNGIYEIQNGKPEVIIPEVFDFFQENLQPKYLRILQGRYLFVEIFDEELLTGRGLFRDGQSPESVLILPGADATTGGAIDEVVEGGGSICPVIGNYGDYIEQQPGPSELPPDPLEGTLYQPVYTAYLRPPRDSFVNGYDADPCSITFNAELIPMSPIIETIDDYSGGYRVVEGDEMYLDGLWTIERFIAVQTALWAADAANMAELLLEISSKSESREYSISTDAAPYVGEGNVRTECYGDKTGVIFTEGKFGLSGCQFWLTRYAIGVAQVVTKDNRYAEAEDTLQNMTFIGYSVAGVGGAFGSIAAAISFYNSTLLPDDAVEIDGDGPPGSFTGGGWGIGYHFFQLHTVARVISGIVVGGVYVQKVFQVSSGFEADGYNEEFITESEIAGRYKKTFHMEGQNALNIIEMAPVPDTAYCVLVGWKYTKDDNTEGFIARGEECTDMTSLIDDSENRQPPYNIPTPLPIGDDGSVCGVPFEPVTVPGDPEYSVSYPDQEVVYPGVTFLLRDGTGAPLYPVRYGAYVYDTHLKKWGKCVVRYSELLDYSPLNSTTDGIVATSTFGILAGIADPEGGIRLFDSFPAISYITYGKIGYYRLGLTSLEEMHVDFRDVCTGYMRIEGSFDGKNLQDGLQKQLSYENVRQFSMYGVLPARWHTVTIGGYYDITHLEYRGYRQGRR
jgi:hypothetical protein